MSGLATSEGKPPRWVALGLGALAASHVEPGSPYYRKIRHDAVEAVNVGWTSKASDALGDQDVQTPVVRAVGFALMDSIAASYDRGVLPAFVKEMGGGGAKLDAALGTVLNLDRSQFLAGTGEFVMSRYGR
ncbi:MAG: hypothetical protein LC745_07025 [Planctomycetia bacterium]|nr:hypothetical protein [Planctomycetia bacterium]